MSAPRLTGVGLTLAAALIARPAAAESVVMRCRPLAPDPGKPGITAERLDLDLQAPRLELSSPVLDATGQPSRWVFQNRPDLGDRVAVVRSGDLVSIAAMRIVPHAFTLDLKSGAFTWSYSDEKGPAAFRFTCRRM